MTREEAIDILRSYLMFDKSNMQIDIALNMAIEALKDRPQGKWIRVYVGKYYSVLHRRCNQCGAVIEDSFFGYEYDVNFCPSCGADMRGGTE